MELKTEHIWTKYRSELERFIRSKIKDKDACGDILQDVFLKVHLNLGKLEQEHKVQPWVYQIARNAIHDHFRKQKHFTNTDDIDVQEELPVGNGQAFAKCLKSFVKHLPLKYREAITKVEFGDLSQLEFAKQLNISYSGAKSRVQRAKEMLKSHFLDCCNVSTDKYGNIVSLKEKSKCGICEI